MQFDRQSGFVIAALVLAAAFCQPASAAVTYNSIIWDQSVSIFQTSTGSWVTDHQTLTTTEFPSSMNDFSNTAQVQGGSAIANLNTRDFTPTPLPNSYLVLGQVSARVDSGYVGTAHSEVSLTFITTTETTFNANLQGLYDRFTGVIGFHITGSDGDEVSLNPVTGVAGSTFNYYSLVQSGVLDPGQYTLKLDASQSGGFDTYLSLVQFTLDPTPSPVPLPGAFALLLSGLAPVSFLTSRSSVRSPPRLT